MMRLSTNQMYNNSMNGVMQSYQRFSHVNNQMSSGKRVLTPADDPVAAAQTLNTRNRMAVVQQYNRNVDFADKNLSLTESALDQTEFALMRMKDMSIQLGSDQWSDNQVNATGLEAKETLNHMQGLVNTRNESGEYIFAGSQADQKAYDGNTFVGDRIEREAQVADDTFIRMLTSGDRAFENLEGLKPAPVKVSDLAADDFSDVYASEQPLLVFRSQADELAAAADPVAWLADNVFSFPEGTSDADKEAWITANAADIESKVPGLDIAANTYTAANPSQSGTDFRHEDNMLGVMQYFVDATGNGNPPEAVNKEAIRASIDNIDIAFEQVSKTRAQIGARQNTLDAVKSSNEEFELFAKKSISDLEDLDYAEAYVRLETSMLSYQAGMQITGRISGLSLFNYI
ncbi:flagellar hook-associated protein FlgL [Marinospirillum sp.]|uniref:flagellar hook-associated protein FlgL n=1 Tax=Marinospirillum sp. TaxID=2183934 RepID=UPI003A8B1379